MHVRPVNTKLAAARVYALRKPRPVPPRKPPKGAFGRTASQKRRKRAGKPRRGVRRGTFDPQTTVYSPCPCCEQAKGCFQEWYAVWHCDTQSWSGPVEDNKVCLPIATTPVGWVKISEDGATCEYKIYVPMGTPTQHTCAANADCSEYPNTDNPGVPDDPVPGECCCCTKQCFRAFNVGWDCDTLAWGGVTDEGTVCQRPGANVTNQWFEYAMTEGVCIFRMLVPCGGEACDCCETAADCDVPCAGMDTPGPPGADNTECCHCPCEGADCGGCGFGLPHMTPNHYTVSFGLQISPNKNVASGPNGDGLWFCGGLVGSLGEVSFDQDPGNPCVYYGSSGTLKVKRCYSPTGDGVNCPCALTEDVTLSIDLVMSVGPFGAAFSGTINTSSSEIGSGIALDFAVGGGTSTYIRCCKPWVQDSTGTAPLAGTAWNTVGNGAILITPC